MKAFLICIAVFSLHNNFRVPRSSEHELTRRRILSGKASMLIPRDFVVMDTGTIALKYPSAGHRPSEVYTTPKGSINIALNHTKNAANDTELEAVKETMNAQLNRPPIDFIRSEVRQVNGKKFIVMEFVSQAADTRIYNLMAITSLEGRLAMITFNCTESQMKEWVPTGKKMISSIQI